MTVITCKIMCVYFTEKRTLKDPMTPKKGQEPLKQTFPDLLKLSSEHLKQNYTKDSTYLNTCAQSWYKQPSCLPALRITVQLAPLKSALHGNITCMQHTHARTHTHEPATAALHSLNIHVVNKADTSCHSQNNTGATISGKKYTFFPKYYPIYLLCPDDRC